MRKQSLPQTIHRVAHDLESSHRLSVRGRTRMNRIIHGENLAVLKQLTSQSFELIYIDPPFNTGRHQVRPRTSSIRDPQGPRTGFGGKRYRTVRDTSSSLIGYADDFDDYVGFLRPRIVEAHRLLTAHGAFFLHVDPREVHYCKVMLDEVFGRDCFQNEIIWAYDYGARATEKWPAKHDNILWYTRNPKRYVFRLDKSDRIPYMAPKLVGPAKAARGKTPTDVCWHTIVSPTGKEKTGYATQKPLGILERIIRVHSRPGDTVLDFFAGSGTTGLAALRNKRHFLLIDESPEAIAVMQTRLQLNAETFTSQPSTPAIASPPCASPPLPSSASSPQLPPSRKPPQPRLQQARSAPSPGLSHQKPSPSSKKASSPKPALHPDRRPHRLHSPAGTKD